MLQLPEIDLTVFIYQRGRELVTDSRVVAIAFGKQHRNVLRTIEAMRASHDPEINEHSRLSFEPAEFIDRKGKPRPMYRVTRHGMGELSVTFTGDKIQLIRIRFGNAFKVVAKQLADRDAELVAREEARNRSINEQLHALARREAPVGRRLN